MNDTVAIALITSLSTLSAAGITGSIGAWVSRNQASNQRVVAPASRRASHGRQERIVRRDAFVAAAREALELDVAWQR